MRRYLPSPTPSLLVGIPEFKPRQSRDSLSLYLTQDDGLKIDEHTPLAQTFGLFTTENNQYPVRQSGKRKLTSVEKLYFVFVITFFIEGNHQTFSEITNCCITS